MTRRLVILTEIISPYRIPLFNALAQDSSVDLHVIFMAETDPTLREWQVLKEEIQFSYQVLPAWRKRLGKYNVLLNRGMWRALGAAAPDVILCGGYNYVASWQALAWAKVRNVPFVLWSESTHHDLRRGHAAVELMKAEFLHHCSGFVVPGRSSEEYLRILKVETGRIFTAPNAVDNELFYRAAAAARQNESVCRAKFNLPNRYFLFVGRLVREKGVFELLAAYAKLDEAIRETLGLVLVGGGSARQELEAAASHITPGVIKFAGFVQRDQLAVYYAMSDMLILPTYTDPWGLVVNEAMACGLPVIVSRVAGCAADLLRDGWSGLLVTPLDVASLASAMRTLANLTNLRKEMGANSGQLILQYSPREWSRAIVRMVEANGAFPD